MTCASMSSASMSDRGRSRSASLYAAAGDGEQSEADLGDRESPAPCGTPGGASLGLKALEISQSLEDAGDNCLEERLLPREVSIDRRLACRRHLRDLIEAGALIALLKEHPLSCIEDPRFDVARQVFGRSSLSRPFGITAVCSPSAFTPCIHDAASDEAR